MNEIPVIFFVFAIISIFLPVGFMYFISRKKEKEYIRQIDLKVKKKLITKDNYSDISLSTLRLVKNSLIKNAIVKTLVYTAVWLGYGFLFKEKEIIKFFVIIAVIFLTAFTLKFIYDIRKISKTENLIKIKGFLFRKKGYTHFVLWYDMKKLKYRVFSYNTFFSDNYSADLGSFVNIIAIRKKSSIKIIRLLSF